VPRRQWDRTMYYFVREDGQGGEIGKSEPFASEGACKAEAIKACDAAAPVVQVHEGDSLQHVARSVGAYHHEGTGADFDPVHVHWYPNRRR
jgi:hypothetical protein